MAALLNPFHVFAHFTVSYFAGLLVAMYILARMLAERGPVEAVEAEHLLSSILVLLSLIMVPLVAVAIFLVATAMAGYHVAPVLRLLIFGFLAGMLTTAALAVVAAGFAILKELRE